METAKAEQTSWRRFVPDLRVILWGLVGGILIPFFVNWVLPRGACDSQYLLSLPASSLPFWFFLIYPFVGVIVTVVVAVPALRGRPAWLILVHGPITLGVSVWLFVVSGLLAWSFMAAPQVKDRLVVEGKQYALAFCEGADFEGGDVGLYRCDDERLWSCHLLVRGGVGMMQNPSLRYKDGNLIIDDTLFGPLIYPLDGVKKPDS
jgi:hypothetical protein